MELNLRLHVAEVHRRETASFLHRVYNARLFSPEEVHSHRFAHHWNHVHRNY